MPSSVITADIFCALFLIILFFNEIGNKNKLSIYYRLVASFTFSGLLLHALSVYLANYVLFGDNIFLGVLIMIVSMVIMVLFAYYVYSAANEKRPTSIWVGHSIMIAEAICSMTIIVLVTYEYATLGNVESFSFGMIFFTMFIVQALCSLYLLAFVITRFRLFTRKSAISLIVYLLLPFVSLIIRFFYGDFDYMMAALGLSLIVLYMGLQNVQMIEFKLREQIYNEQPVTDELTGLGSKRAFLNLKNLILSRESVGIVCCSLNELKHVNDTLGDNAGDELIQRIAYLIKNDFSRYDSFRVSGDKFIVVITNEEIDVFKSVVIDFMKDINAYDQIASVGSSYGLGKHIDSILAEADRLMYENKRSYYEQRTHDRRSARR